MRVNFVNIIVGNRGTGKTTFIKGNAALGIKGVLQQYPFNKKILVIDTFDNPVWGNVPIVKPEDIQQFIKSDRNGIHRTFSSDIKELSKQLEMYVYNCVLVFEDATKFIGSKLTEDFNRFILDSKQKNVDIFFLFHYMAGVPLDLTRVADWLILFKTNEIFDSFTRKRFPNPDVATAFNLVKEHKNKFHYEPVKISA